MNDVCDVFYVWISDYLAPNYNVKLMKKVLRLFFRIMINKNSP